MLEDISTLAGHIPKLTLLDLDAIVFDSTGSNTGRKTGLAGCIVNGRQELWKKLGHQDDAPEFIIHKCEDHILNLISVDYEKALMHHSSSLTVSNKHRATDVVQYIIAKVFFLYFLN
jgi:hypothetical protein